jgi:tetratricopeptide (TPR) repeat protein
MAYIQGEAYDAASACDSYRKAEQAAQAWLAESPGNPTARGRLALSKERLAWFATLAGEPAGAEDAIQESIAIYQQLAAQSVPGERREAAMAYKTLAEVQKRIGRKKEALANCRQSLESSKAMQAESPQDDQTKTDIAQETVLLVDLLRENGQPDEAREQTKRALADLKPLALAANPKRTYLVDYVALLVGTAPAPFATAEEAIKFAKTAVDFMKGADPETLDLLAKAFDRAGRVADAVAVEQKAIAQLPPLDPGRPMDQRRRELDETLATLQAKAAKAGAKRPTQ